MSGQITVVSRFDKKKPGAIRKMITRSASPVGNPFVMETEADRDSVCDQFHQWVLTDSILEGPEDNLTAAARQWVMDRAAEYRAGKHIELCCNCAPKRCHGETLQGLIHLISEEEWRFE